MDNKCTNFLFSLNKDEKIFGSSPEKIIHLTNKKFITEAIAGTYPKTNSDTKQNLLNNKKELYNNIELSFPDITGMGLPNRIN